MSLSRLLAIGAVLCSLVTHPLLAIGDAPGRSVAPDVLQNYGRLPLHLEANEGQTDPQVKFLARGQGYTVFLTATETVLVLRPSGVERDAVERPATVVRLRLEPRTAGEPQMLGLDELAGRAN